MKAFLTMCIVSGALLAGGCATKKYVRDTTAPIQAKVDQVGTQTAQNGQQIEKSQADLKELDERTHNGISAAQERASSADARATAADQHAATADTHAGEAMTKANTADSKADRALGAIANLDDYKLQTASTVQFAFNSFALTGAGKESLDKLAGEISADKRFFIAVEGFTDKTGNRQYNEQLSAKRADAVVEYLVGQRDVPIYRIHRIGLGDAKPADPGKDREARVHNRRVEVKVFLATNSADSTATVGTTAQTPDNF